MPGSVSDSYDPEFGTGENAATVREAIVNVRDIISTAIGSEELRPILEVANGDGGPPKKVSLTEQQLRLIRFSMNRALESI